MCDCVNNLWVLAANSQSLVESEHYSIDKEGEALECRRAFPNRLSVIRMSQMETKPRGWGAAVTQMGPLRGSARIRPGSSHFKIKNGVF